MAQLLLMDKDTDEVLDTIFVEDAQVEALEKLAVERGVSVEALILEALRRGLENV